MAYTKALITTFDDGTQLMEDANPTVEANPSDEFYIVCEGDTLLSISYQFYRNHTNWDSIAKRNDLVDPWDLTIGTTLAIPPTNG